MQGWFAFPDSPHFIPNHFLLPIFVGTHFTTAIQKFLQYFIVYYPWYFEGKTMGCRDLATLGFCEKLGLEAYFSRCLTLTLPKRTQEEAKQATKVFLVGIPENLLKFIPQNLREGAISVNQQNISNEKSLQWQNFYHRSENLLETYKNEAKLIITCALHCASPSIAMGIPVVLIARNQENIQRFSALSGIVPIYTLEDLEKGRVDFAPQSLNIESLKADMLENLKLSIRQEMGESVDTQALQAIRQRIADFAPAMQPNAAESQGDSTTSGGGGVNPNLEAKSISDNANLWKRDFKYDLEFKQRAQILLDLLSPEARESLESVLDLGCGVQYFREVLRENHLNPSYVGVDLYPHQEDNILCDFNQGEFPYFSKDSFTLIVCAGLFEYIWDLPKFIKRICSLSPKLILCSYNFINASEIDNEIWVRNRLTQEELFNVFLQNNYCLNVYKTHKRNLPTGYFCFCKKELMGKV